MNRQQLRILVLSSTLILARGSLALADESVADDPHAAHRQMSHSQSEAAAAGASVSIPDATLTNQHGQPLNLLHDVVGDHIVVMDFVYTHCTTVCPVLSAVLMQVQTEVADALGSEIVLASLTVDPLRDTPRQLDEYSQKFQASADWHWLTSDKPTMDAVLKELGAYTANFEDHPSMVLVGDARTSNWSRFAGFPTPRLIVDKVQQLRHARMEAHHD